MFRISALAFLICTCFCLQAYADPESLSQVLAQRASALPSYSSDWTYDRNEVVLPKPEDQIEQIKQQEIQQLTAMYRAKGASDEQISKLIAGPVAEQVKMWRGETFHSDNVCSINRVNDQVTVSGSLNIGNSSTEFTQFYDGRSALISCDKATIDSKKVRRSSPVVWQSNGDAIFTLCPFTGEGLRLTPEMLCILASQDYSKLYGAHWTQIAQSSDLITLAAKVPDSPIGPFTGRISFSVSHGYSPVDIILVGNKSSDTIHVTDYQSFSGAIIPSKFVYTHILNNVETVSETWTLTHIGAAKPVSVSVDPALQVSDYRLLGNDIFDHNMFYQNLTARQTKLARIIHEG